MNYKSKYIVVDTGNFVAPIVFTDLLAHADIAYQMGAVLGAGFCYINEDGHYTCYGESVSLNVKSRGDEDARILNKYLGVIYE